MTSDDYRYQPLPPVSETGKTPWYTRILWLAPGRGEEPLSAGLELAALAPDIQPYEALSYTWGTDAPSDYLWMQGCPMPIRPNLAAALTHLRLPSQHRRLWIDALCINQNDVDERTRQVQYMRHVYRHCARVIVWVGTKVPGVETAFETARRLNVIRERGEELKRPGQPRDVEALRRLWEECLVDMPPDSIQKLCELWDRPYFTRCWCIQEVTACNRALLKCEELEMSFDELAGTVFALATLRQEARQNTVFFLWWRIWDARQKNPSFRADAPSSLGDLLNLLDTTRPFQATDIRDKIFALQGVSDEGLNPVLATTRVMGNSEGRALKAVRWGLTKLFDGVNSLHSDLDVGRPLALKPNYRKPAVDVYIDVTRFMMRKSPRVLDVLNHVMHQGDPEDVSEYPSWVPRWFEPKTLQIMQGYFLSGFCDGHYRYFATVHDNHLQSTCQRPRILSIDGFHVDVVRTVSSDMHFPTPSDEHTVVMIEHSWSQIFPFPMIPRPQHVYRDNTALDHAFCKTISAHPFGDMIGMVNDASFSGVDMRMPADFKEQFMSTIVDGGRRSGIFVQALAEHRARGQPSSTYEADADAARFLGGVRLYANNRRIFITQDGRLGLGPGVMQAGDEVVVLFGGRMPFVVRRKGQHHVFIGQCYINDDFLMQGKVTEQILRRNSGPPRTTYHIH